MRGYQARVQGVLKAALPAADLIPQRLHAAQRYAVLSGGKRLRPLLVYCTGEALKVPAAMLDTPAAAVELIHSYSLVHDDLPAMDDDDLRRGQPTTHRAFDEATAILAGDALQVLAFSLLSRDRTPGLSADARLKMIQILADASGTPGMAGGQAIDLAAVGRPLTLEELEAMHRLKTGALDPRQRVDGGGVRADPKRRRLGRVGSVFPGHRARVSNPRRHSRRRGQNGRNRQNQRRGRRTGQTHLPQHPRISKRPKSALANSKPRMRQARAVWAKGPGCWHGSPPM